MLEFSVIGYLLLTVTIGFISIKKIKNAGDFINAGRSLHPALNTAALFALWFGSETVFGASAEFSKHGLQGIIEDPLGGVLCLLLVGLVFSRKLYRLNVMTIGDLFRIQYGQKIEIVASLLMVFSFVGYASAQIVALGLLSQTLFQISLVQGMALSACIVVLYTFTGGMWAVSLTDFMQSIVIIIGLITISWYVNDMVGGVSVVAASLTPESKQFFPHSSFDGWVNWIAAWMVLGFGSIASQDVFQRINSARSEDAAYYSTLIGAFLYLVFSALPLFLVTAIKILDPSLMLGDLQLVLPQFVVQAMPLYIQILFFGSLISAIMSTCSGALLAPASLLAENFFKPVFPKLTTGKGLLFLTRASVLVIGFTAFLLALSSQSIFELVSEASIFGLVTIFVPMVAALFFKHNNAVEAFTSMLSGLCVYTIFRVTELTLIEPLVPGFIASIAGIYITRLWKK